MAGKTVTQPADTTDAVWSHVPDACRDLADAQRDLPRSARDQALMAQIESAVRSVPTRHDLHLGDARRMGRVAHVLQNVGDTNLLVVVRGQA